MKCDGVRSKGSDFCYVRLAMGTSLLAHDLDSSISVDGIGSATITSSANVWDDRYPRTDKSLLSERDICPSRQR